MNSQERILRLFMLLMTRRQITKTEMISAETDLYRADHTEKDLENRKKRFQRDIQIIRQVLASTSQYRLQDNHRGVYTLIELSPPTRVNQRSLADQTAVAVNE
ncbi:hypothetical protein [Lapidilactobacillus luobeiensis]|uniref:hypothetical protein n=1 Tax=Lapidilactobacillus luobeiensis TaxID=2950371 RepID=UPI0021C27A37|nr:hypothetical protein [Lapidilactobacillus luobeiensis]